MIGLINYIRRYFHECEWKIYGRSNILTQDDFGYPLRFCNCRCVKCGQHKQLWIDEPDTALEELKTGESVLVKWESVKK